MAAFPPSLGPLAIDQPTTGAHTVEPWLEPFLIKHSAWYRRHMVKHGRRESKSQRRASVSSQAEIENEERRRSSVATADSEHVHEPEERDEIVEAKGKEREV